jgi:hypothetical protein
VVFISALKRGMLSSDILTKIFSIHGKNLCNYVSGELGSYGHSSFQHTGYKGDYVGYFYSGPGYRPEYIDTESCTLVNLNKDDLVSYNKYKNISFHRTIVGPSGRYIISPLDSEGNHALSFWKANNSEYSQTLNYDFLKLIRTDEGKGYLALQRFEDGRRLSEKIHLWETRPLRKKITISGHMGGIAFKENSRGSSSLKATEEGNVVSLSRSGDLKVWPLYLEDPQALIGYANRWVSRELTTKQREKFHLQD